MNRTQALHAINNYDLGIYANKEYLSLIVNYLFDNFSDFRFAGVSVGAMRNDCDSDIYLETKNGYVNFFICGDSNTIFIRNRLMNGSGETYKISDFDDPIVSQILNE